MSLIATIHRQICVLIYYSSMVLFLVGGLVNKVSSLTNHAEHYTARSFGLIQSSSFPHFVMFFAPWCSHCEKILPTWDKYAEKNHQLKRFKVAKVDCAESTPVCAKEMIKAYPTFRLFNGVAKYTFRGSRNIADFDAFAETYIPDLQNGKIKGSDGVYERTENQQQQSTITPKTFQRSGAQELSRDQFYKQIEKDMTFVDFFAPWCAHCRQLEPVWNQLADYYEDVPFITIAKVDCTAEPELCQQLSINSYPSLVLFKDGSIIDTYRLDRSLNSLVEYVQRGLHAEYGSETEKTNQQSVTTPPPPPPIPTTGLIKADLEDYKLEGELLLGSRVCVLFHDYESFQQTKEFIEFELFAEYLSKTTLPIAIYQVDCTKKDELCEKYSTIFGFWPSVAYFYVTNGEIRHRLFTGEIIASSLLEFVKKEERRYSTLENRHEL